MGSLSVACHGSETGVDGDRAACDEARRVGSLEGWRAYRQRYATKGTCAAEAAQAIQRLDEGMKAERGKATRKSLAWRHSMHAGVWFTRSEITVAEYRECVDAGVCLDGFQTKDSEDSIGDRKWKLTDCNYGYHDRDDHPMNCVDHAAAQRYCAWIEARLPTTEEWLSEATASSTRRYPWGNEAADCDRAVIMKQMGPPDPRCTESLQKTDLECGNMKMGCGESGTWSVCSHENGNSESGLCDMIGNVGELTGSHEPGPDTRFVVLGGSYSSDPRDTTRASGMFRGLGLSGDQARGFRCVSPAMPEGATLAAAPPTANPVKAVTPEETEGLVFRIGDLVWRATPTLVAKGRTAYDEDWERALKICSTSLGPWRWRVPKTTGGMSRGDTEMCWLPREKLSYNVTYFYNPGGGHKYGETCGCLSSIECNRDVNDFYVWCVADYYDRK